MVPSLTLDEILSERFSCPFEPLIEVEKRGFGNKLEMAKYLEKVFRKAGVDWRKLIDIDGLWNWLSVFWFDELTDGGSKIRNMSHYILDSGRYRYRHLVRSAFLIYSIHGEEVGLLYMHPSEWGELWEQIAGRGYLLSSKTLMLVIQQICWDEKNHPKKGATVTIREIWRLLNQFRRTYDAGGMSPSEVRQLLQP
jgi:hypothetical protein